MSIKLEGTSKLICETFPGKPKWNVEQAPDQTEKVILITGGNSGIGFETAKALLNKNATVYIGARSTAKAAEAVEELKKETSNDKIHVIQMDLADLPTIPKAVEDFKSKESQLHVLIDNAGLMFPPLDLLTTQGYDAQFGTMVLGHYVLSKLLLPIMEATAATLPPTDPVRIIEVTSDGHLFNSGTKSEIIRYDTLVPGAARDKAGSAQMYSQSKSGNILISKARARLLADKNIISMSVHPGHIQSNLQRYASPLEAAMAKGLLSPTPFGAITSTFVATTPDIEGINGQYFAPWAKMKVPRTDHVDNVEAEERLVEWCEEQTRLHNIQ